MRLRVAGINHNDLLGRDRLWDWLFRMKHLEKAPPAFVAVEYDEKIFRKIRQQRPRLRMLAEEAWPGSSPSVLKAIEHSLAYEGDLHEGVFPGIETVWLDRSRKVDDPTIVSEYARDRMAIYKSFAPSGQKTLSNASLRDMSDTAWTRGSMPRSGGSERDARFARVILDRLRSECRGWAIVIVGSGHASETEGSMANRLRREGIKCQVNQLRP